MTEQKISPFQLTALLTVGQLFVLLTLSPPAVTAGSFLWGVAAALLLQLPLALLLQRLAVRSAQSAKNGRFARLLHSLWAVLGALLCLGGAVWTATAAARLLSDCFYGGGRFWTLLLLLAAAAVVTAVQGLSGFCRATPLVALLCLGGVGVLLAGAAPTLQPDYLPPLTTTAPGLLRVTLGSTIANLELLLLPLLVGHCTKPLKVRAIAVWLGGRSLLAAVLGLFAMLSLGWYAQDKLYPVRELARAAPLLQGRLDALLLGLWVLPALLRLAALLWVAGQLLGKLLPKAGAAARRVLLRGGGAVCLALLLLAGCDSPTGSIASKTLVTLVELAPAGEQTQLRLEYLDISGGKESKRFRVCEGQGESVAAALAGIEQDFSRSFYLDSVSLAVLSGEPTPQWVAARLAELDAPGGLRPRTNLLCSKEPILQADRDEEQSAATALRRLFVPQGLLDAEHTLKDALARLRDNRLTFALPLVAERDGQPVVTGSRTLK